MHERQVAAAQNAMAAGDAEAAIEHAQNAINLKGRESTARDLLAEAKALQKAQEAAAKEAVSYTHLDVYKRQVIFINRLFFHVVILCKK